jgi:uncharacterized membrane protein YfcA
LVQSGNCLTVFNALITIAAVAAGAIAAITGFGIGSLLTPLVSIRAATGVAVAAVSIPHFAATALRFWLMRRHVDRRVLLRFGILSAAGGLTGALLQPCLSSRALAGILAALLLFAGATSLTGISRRLRFGKKMAWAAGILSGLLGGLVGNQGGIRSAALLGFQLDRQAFVATATGAGLIVDAARIPFYLSARSGELWEWWGLIVLLSAGVLLGTIAGARLLRQIPEASFHRVVGVPVLLLGVYMAWRAIPG